MRIGGLASGMDTDQMVKDLMKAENVRVDKVKADKQILEWKKESLNSLNKDFANFILDSKKDLGYNSVGRPGNQDWIKSAVSSDESIGTATAGKGAFGGKHTVTVTELAKGVSGSSNVKVGTYTPQAFNFKVNDKTISVSITDTLESIAKKINASGAGVEASFDKDIGRFFIRTETEGAAAKIEFTADAGVNTTGLDNFLNTIKVDIRVDGSPTPKTLASGVGNGLTGENGKATYNGVPDLEITSNQFTFNGVNFDAKVANEKFTITVDNNADEIVEKVTKFIDDYNKMIEKAGSLISEKQNKNFRPLTSEQREAMSENEVKLWDEKAKSGLIRGDMDIDRMLSNLRSDLYKNVEGVESFKSITELGITTQGYKAGGVGGMLQIDEKKLREAIAKDADGVMDMLFKEDPLNATKDDGDLAKITTKEDGITPLKDEKGNLINGLTNKRNNSGIMTRIFDNLTLGMKEIIGKSGPGNESELFRKVKSTIMTQFVTNGGKNSGQGSVSDIDKDMATFTKKIDQLAIDLFKKENMYYARFTAMEKAMQRASSQSGWLAQQM